MNKKTELLMISTGFILLNCYAVVHNQTLFGIGFGVTAAVFLTRALRAK